MDHEAQVAQARKLLAYVQSRTTAMAPEVYRNAVREYVCPRQLAQERELFFSRCPSMVGLSCLVPAPGDYVTHDYSGTPLLLVRQADGSLRAFLNVMPPSRRPACEWQRERAPQSGLPLSRMVLRQRWQTSSAPG